MMKKYPFSLKTEEDIILVQAQLNEDGLCLVLDTAATQTVIDLNTLLIMGYPVSSLQYDTARFETSSGVIEAQKLRLDTLSALGIERTNYEIFTYDFLLAGIASPYDGACSD